MIDPQSEAALVGAYHRERLSLLQYVRQALPYAGRADRPVLDRVLAMSRAEAEILDRLTEYLDDQRVRIPPPGAFPSPFTNYNFMAVRKILPRLIEDEAGGLAALEKAASTMPSGEPRTWVERLAEAKRQHLADLGKLPG